MNSEALEARRSALAPAAAVGLDRPTCFLLVVLVVWQVWISVGGHNWGLGQFLQNFLRIYDHRPCSCVDLLGLAESLREKERAESRLNSEETSAKDRDWFVGQD